MTSETQQKKQVQVLQRCIVNALEDVKAIDIQVFNTEHLTPLFERVVVASGNSNRQTKALAASVRDDVREAGFDKPRIEGEENGEWIIVDCGAAVVHIMQPAIRAYYRLEEIWGEKAVKLRSAAPVKASKKASEIKPAAKKAATKTSPAAKKAATKTSPAAKKTTVKKPVTKKTTGTSAPTAVPKTAEKKAPSPASKKPTVKRAVAGKTTRSTAAQKATAKPARKKSVT